MKKYGDRLSVFEGLAQFTRGGLTKDDLIVSKSGKIVSRKKSEAAKKNYETFGFSKRKIEKVEEVVEEKQEKPEKKKRKRRKKKTE